MFVFFILQLLYDLLRNRELDVIFHRVLDGEGVGLVESLEEGLHHGLGRHLLPLLPGLSLARRETEEDYGQWESLHGSG